MQGENFSNFLHLAKELSPESNEAGLKVLAAVLSDAYSARFDEASYMNISEKPLVQVTGEQRLFIAKGKMDGMTPGTLIKFIENEVGMNIGDVGKIDIMEKFSYMNVQAAEAEVILDYFKVQNRRKPLIVQAKSRDGESSGGGSRGGYRGER